MADIVSKSLIEDTILQVKEARNKYDDATINFNEANRQFNLGDLEESDYREAFEAQQKAYGDLQNICEAHFLVRSISDD